MARDTSPELPEPPSSSPPLSSSQQLPKYKKTKKPPPVTPNRFNRFFNPRSSSSISSNSARVLREYTSSRSNRQPHSLHTVAAGHVTESQSPRKRIKYSFPDKENTVSGTEVLYSSSPPISSPCRDYGAASPKPSQDSYPQPIMRRKPLRQKLFPSLYTADFVSTVEDKTVLSKANLPFCAASCNTNSLVAIGTERGEIHILESAKNTKHSFSTPFLQFAPHQNAIMDLAFTADDARLASASGDQTAQIIDMYAQTPIHVLAEHTSSLKQIAFQPGNENIVATCCRDSVVALWDLRCATSRPVLKSLVSPEEQEHPPPKYASMYKAIADIGPGKPSTREGSGVPPKRATTAIAFIPQSPHHLVTSTDASSHLRVWDVRSRMLSTRTRSALPMQLPVSTSAELPSSLELSAASNAGKPYKNRGRQYGTTSICLGNDGARLYAVSRDNSVHVYSTSHLILGQVAEPAHPHKQATESNLQGAPPLYTLRDPCLRVGSFYIRAAIRRTGPSSHWPELLAVGNSEARAVLFPTDAIDKLQSPLTSHDYSISHTYPMAPRSPIAEGTPLVAGHRNEVSGLAWTYDGELVTCGDDSAVRVWREDREQAEMLRSCGPKARYECGLRKREGCGWSMPQDLEGGGPDNYDSDESY